MKRTVIVGAGISGLSAAFDLAKAGRDVTVFESSDRIGGCVSTLQQDGYLFELGPNSFPDNCHEVIQLAEDCGISHELITAREAAATRYLYMNRELIPIPMNPKLLLTTKMFTFPQKLRILGERFVRKRRSEEPESVAQFFYRRFGRAATRTLVDAFVSGIYAGDARRIGLRSAFPLLHEMEQKHGSIIKAMARRRKKGKQRVPTLMSFRHGLSELIDAVAAQLKGHIHIGRSVRRLDRTPTGYRLHVRKNDGSSEEVECEEVILATPAPVAALILASEYSMVADLLEDVAYAPVMSVQAGFVESELENLPDAFGYLVPRPQRMRTLGWLFGSRIFEGRAPEGRVALSGFIGGDTDPHVVDAPRRAVRHQLLGELSMVLRMGRIPEPEFFSIVPHRPGLPQSHVGHNRRIAALEKLLAGTPTLRIIGNYVRGISIDNCIGTARRTAREMLGRENGA